MFERPGIPVLGDCLTAGSGVPVAAVVEVGVDGALGRLIEPKPLNSGTSSPMVGVALSSAVLSSPLLGVRGVEGLAICLVGVEGLFPSMVELRSRSRCEEIDFARSVC